MKAFSFRIVGLLFLAAMAFFSPGSLGEARGAAWAPVTADADLVIPLAAMSDRAVWYPVRIDGGLVEFFAVKAPDGSVRVVVNACQSCGPAGFDQVGDSFQCTACGQGFPVAALEKQKGGCNPIPVGDRNKRVEADRIVLPKGFIKQVAASRYAKERSR